MGIGSQTDRNGKYSNPNIGYSSFSGPFFSVVSADAALSEMTTKRRHFFVLIVSTRSTTLCNI